MLRSANALASSVGRAVRMSLAAGLIGVGVMLQIKDQGSEILQPRVQAVHREFWASLRLTGTNDGER